MAHTIASPMLPILALTWCSEAFVLPSSSLRQPILALGMTAGQRAERRPPREIPKRNKCRDSELFDRLARIAGVEKRVSLGAVENDLRGLVVDCDIEEGQVVLEVPSQLCLWSNRDGVVSGLLGQTDLCWEAAGDLRNPVSDADFERGMTWDVRLALAVLEATADAQIGGQFWHVYGDLLPRPHTVAVPFCLPERLLTQLHNDGMAERARKQVERLRSLYPDLMRSLLSHPRTAVYVATGKPAARGQSDDDASGTRIGEGAAFAEGDATPMALAWAFALVRSRAFAGGDDRFAFVPFLDMANHGFAPNSNFTYEDPGVFRLRAMRNLRAEEEVTISYGEGLDAEQLMVQYGFPAPESVALAYPLADPVASRDRHSSSLTEAAEARAAVDGDEADQVLAMAADQQEKVRRELMDELLLRGQQRFAREAAGDERIFETMVKRAIPLIPTLATAVINFRGDDALADGANAYLEVLKAYRSRSFPTSEEQDRELLRFCTGDGRGKVDPRLADVVRYRLGRKEAHTLAEDLLQELVGHTDAPNVMDDGSTQAG